MPDELSLDAALLSNVGFSGVSGVGLSMCYSGPPGGAEKILRAIRSAGTPFRDNIGAVDYVALQRSGDLDDRCVHQDRFRQEDRAPAHRRHGYRSGRVPRTQRRPGFSARRWGALACVAGRTAFPRRDIHATALLNAVWPAKADATPHVTWLRRYWASIVPHTYGFCTNDAIGESQRPLDENYLGNYPRLVKVKNKYDPTNLFRLNANLRPTV